MKKLFFTASLLSFMLFSFTSSAQWCETLPPQDPVYWDEIDDIDHEVKLLEEELDLILYYDSEGLLEVDRAEWRYRILDHAFRIAEADGFVSKEEHFEIKQLARELGIRLKRKKRRNCRKYRHDRWD